jgi:hypothetical protein
VFTKTLQSPDWHGFVFNCNSLQMTSLYPRQLVRRLMSNNGDDSCNSDNNAPSIKNVNLQYIVNRGRNRHALPWEVITDVTSFLLPWRGEGKTQHCLLLYISRDPIAFPSYTKLPRFRVLWPQNSCRLDIAESADYKLAVFSHRLETLIIINSGLLCLGSLSLQHKLNNSVSLRHITR